MIQPKTVFGIEIIYHGNSYGPLQTQTPGKGNINTRQYIQGDSFMVIGNADSISDTKSYWDVDLPEIGRPFNGLISRCLQPTIVPVSGLDTIFMKSHMGRSDVPLPEHKMESIATAVKIFHKPPETKGRKTVPAILQVNPPGVGGILVNAYILKTVVLQTAQQRCRVLSLYHGQGDQEKRENDADYSDHKDMR